MVHGIVRGQNDDVVSFVASRNLQQWLERAKKRNDRLWSGNSAYFTLSLSFQINISVKISVGLLRNLSGNLQEKFVRDQLSGLKGMLRRWMRWILTKFPALSCSRPLSRHCSTRLSAVKVWNIVENNACAATVHSFSKSPTTFEYIYTNTFTSKVTRGLSKP